MGEATPFHRRIVAQEMLGRGPHPAQVEIVEPGAERFGLTPDGFGGPFHAATSSFMLSSLAPPGQNSIRLSPAGPISKRAWASSERPSTPAITALITSPWLTAATTASG